MPPGVNLITISASGAQGAGGAGGKGGKATGDLSVTPGQVLNIFVGGQNGYNGGGNGYAAVARNGGGASDVRMGGTALADRIIVGGGGGGGESPMLAIVWVVLVVVESSVPIMPAVEAEKVMAELGLREEIRAAVATHPVTLAVPVAVASQVEVVVPAILVIQAPVVKMAH